LPTIHLLLHVVINQNGAALILPREIFPRKIFLEFNPVGILGLEVLKNLRPDKGHPQPAVSLKPPFSGDESSVLVYGDRVEEPVSFDAGAERVEVFHDGPLTDLPIDYNLGDRELDDSKHGGCSYVRKVGCFCPGSPAGE